MLKKTVPDPVPYVLSSIDTFQSVTISNTLSPLNCFLQNTSSKFHQNNRSKLGFLDLEKVGGISNSNLPLVIAIVIINLTVAGFLVDDESSCNIIYEDALETLGLRQTDLNPSEGEDLITFNYSITHPYGAIDLTLPIRDGTRKRTMTLSFPVIQYKSTFKGILGRSFLAKLDVVASIVHMKITYHDERGALATINSNLQEAKRTRRRIHADILTSASKNCDRLDLNTLKGEIRPAPNGDFESVQLG